MIIMALLVSFSLFRPYYNVVLPRTGITRIQNACGKDGILFFIDGEWAFYRKIGENVFVRQSLNDSLFCKDTVLPHALKYDLDGDGKFEKIFFRKSILRITDYRQNTTVYKHVASFVFYDVNNDGALDLFYTDKSGHLHTLKNINSNRNFALIKSREPFEIMYYTKRRKYGIKLYPAVIQGIIPLKGWKKIELKYHNVSIDLSKGSVINTEKLKSPIDYVNFVNDTLKIAFNLNTNATYNISILGKDTIQIAHGTLPKGAYRFEYYVGRLEKGFYKIKLTLNKEDFFADFVVK